MKKRGERNTVAGGRARLSRVGLRLCRVSVLSQKDEIFIESYVKFLYSKYGKWILSVGGLRLSFDRDSLVRLFNKIVALKDEVGFFSKRKLDRALKEWQKEDRLLYSLLREIMTNIDNIET